jgi:D-3-phosphoglycerate dehydrogenase
MQNQTIQILHIDSNHTILMDELQKAGFTNHEDFTSSKAAIEEKIHNYHGIVIRSRFKIDQSFLDKAVNLQFIARVGAGLESIDCEYAKSKNITLIAMNRLKKSKLFLFSANIKQFILSNFNTALNRILFFFI